MLNYKQLENLSTDNIKNIDPSLIFDFFYNRLQIDTTFEIYKLTFNKNGNKEYFKTKYNNPSEHAFIKANKKIYLNFTPSDLKSYLIKDYKSNKNLQTTLNLIIDNNIKTSQNLQSIVGNDIKKGLKKYGSSDKVFNKLTYLIDSRICRQNKSDYIQTYRLQHNCYAATARKNNQSIVRVDIDCHDLIDWDYHVSINEIQNEIVKFLHKRLPVIYAEKSINNTGLHFYLEIKDNTLSYQEKISLTKKLTKNRILKVLNKYEIPEALNFFNIEVLSSNSQILALPMNSQYEVVNEQGNNLTNFEFYNKIKEYIEYKPKFNCNYNKLFNNYYKLKKDKPKLTLIKNNTGWLKQSNNNNKKITDLKIYKNQRVITTKKIIYELIKHKHHYTFDEFIAIILDNNINSKDIKSWSIEKLKKNYLSFYNLYIKLRNNKYPNTLPKEFISNINLVPDQIKRKLNKIVKNITIKENIGKINKGYSRKNNELETLSILIHEIFGYIIYLSTNDRNKIKSNISFTKENRSIAENNFQLGKLWLSKFKDYYNIDNIDIYRLFKLLIKHNIFKPLYFNQGITSYIYLDNLKIASTYNLNYVPINFIETSSFEDIECAINQFLSTIINKYFIMCKELDLIKVDTGSVLSFNSNILENNIETLDTG